MYIYTVLYTSYVYIHITHIYIYVYIYISSCTYIYWYIYIFRYIPFLDTQFMCKSLKVPSQEFRRDFPREWAAVSTTDGHRIQDWGIRGGMVSLPELPQSTPENFPVPGEHRRKSTFIWKGKSFELELPWFWVQKLLMFQGVLLSFRLQFDEKMWISSKGKWLGTFLLSIFPCHEMDVFFQFCLSATVLVLPLEGNGGIYQLWKPKLTCVGWHDPWSMASMIACSLSEWSMGWLSPAKFLRNHNKII